MRNGEGSSRARIPSLFYPIFIDKDTGAFHSVGTPLAPTESRESIVCPKNTIALLPVSTSGQELQWRLYPPSFLEYMEKGYVKFGKRTKDGKRPVTYLQSGMIEKIHNGQITIIGKTQEGALELEYTDSLGTKKPATIWNMVSHSASEHGSSFVKQILPGRKFPYPKSLYAVHDSINFLPQINPMPSSSTSFLVPAPPSTQSTSSTPRITDIAAASWSPTTRYPPRKQKH